MLERARKAGGGRPDGVSHSRLEIPRDSLGVATPACFARGRGREQDSRCPTNASQRSEIAAPHSHAYDYRRAGGYASLPIPCRSFASTRMTTVGLPEARVALNGARKVRLDVPANPSMAPWESGGRAEQAAAEALPSARAERLDGSQPSAGKPCDRLGQRAERSLNCRA